MYLSAVHTPKGLEEQVELGYHLVETGMEERNWRVFGEEHFFIEVVVAGYTRRGLF